MDITVERNRINGSLELTTIVGDDYYTHRYYDYTVKEAKQLFRQYVKDQRKGIVNV